jgi:hypothetical protein
MFCLEVVLMLMPKRSHLRLKELAGGNEYIDRASLNIHLDSVAIHTLLRSIAIVLGIKRTTPIQDLERFIALRAFAWAKHGFIKNSDLDPLMILIHIRKTTLKNY